jgi:hypothetical protein
VPEKLDPEAVKQAVRSRVAAQRDRHRRRPVPLRVVTAVGGSLLALAGLLLLWVPELGLPLLVPGLGLLALEFDWAVTARASAEWRVAILRDRVRRAPAAVKWAVTIAVVAVTVAAAWFLWAAYR